MGVINKEEDNIGRGSISSRSLFDCNSNKRNNMTRQTTDKGE